MIFVDSGAWYASLIPTDPDYSAAQAWLAQNTEPFFTTDYIVDETLTLLRARGQNPRAISLGSAFVAGSAATLHFITPDEFHAAWHVFQKFSDKEWSFTDCTSKLVVEKLGLTAAFTFDHHFRQFGTVRVVPSKARILCGSPAGRCRRPTPADFTKSSFGRGNQVQIRSVFAVEVRS